jgi:hypothetical protein
MTKKFDRDVPPPSAFDLGKGGAMGSSTRPKQQWPLEEVLSTLESSDEEVDDEMRARTAAQLRRLVKLGEDVQVEANKEVLKQQAVVMDLHQLLDEAERGVIYPDVEGKPKEDVRNRVLALLRELAAAKQQLETATPDQTKAQFAIKQLDKLNDTLMNEQGPDSLDSMAYSHVCHAIIHQQELLKRAR